MTLQEWLLSPLYRDKPLPTAAQRYAELVAVNGGQTTVRSWGCISGGGLYGRTGLDQDEALELISLVGVVDGFLLSGYQEGWQEIVRAEWEAQHQKVAAALGIAHEPGLPPTSKER